MKNGIIELPASFFASPAFQDAAEDGAERKTKKAKVSTVLRHVFPEGEDHTELLGSLVTNKPPEIGSVVLAKVVSVGENKTTLQSPDGRDANLHEGDLILVAYGNRYAVEEYYALMPKDLRKCHLASSGGLASEIQEKNTLMGAPTVIKPLGLIADKDGTVLNTKDFALNPGRLKSRLNISHRPPVLVVVGTGMDAGKTETVSNITKGMSRAGRNVGVSKMTGTGLRSDIYRSADAGATEVRDFVDVGGYPSTYLVPTEEILDIMEGQILCLMAHGADLIVIEVADGVCQEDNIRLFQSDRFKALQDGIILAGLDAPGTILATQKLHQAGLPPLCITGRCTMAASSTIEREYKASLPRDMHPPLGFLTKPKLKEKETARQILKAAHPEKPNIEPDILPEGLTADAPTVGI